MNNKTLALLFVTVAATGLSAQAAEKDASSTAKTPTCMQELKKGKGVKANMSASIKCQERAIGRLAVAGVIEGENLKAVLAKQKEFDKIFTAANKDKKISAAEKKELQAIKKEATSAVFETAWNDDAMATRLEKMKKRIYRGETKGQLTAGEMDILVKELNTMGEKFEKLKAGGLSTAEKKSLREVFRGLSQKIFDDKRDDEGNVAPTADRHKDKIDEIRRNQAARVISCFSGGKNADVIEGQIAKLQTLREKENGYLSDGALSKEEKEDLSQLYKQSGMDINSVCGNADKPKPVDDSRMRPAGHDKPVDDSGMRPSDGSSDTPADPTRQVAPAN